MMNAAGMSRLEVLSAATTAPAAAVRPSHTAGCSRLNPSESVHRDDGAVRACVQLGMEGEIGTLAPGSCGDVTVLEWREPEGGLEVDDMYGNVLRVAGHWEPVLTVRAGEVVFEAAGAVADGGGPRL